MNGLNNPFGELRQSLQITKETTNPSCPFLHMIQGKLSRQWNIRYLELIFQNTDVQEDENARIFTWLLSS
jgi:hypothetical protein